MSPGCGTGRGVCVVVVGLELCTEECGGAGCEVRRVHGQGVRNDSLQQLGADKHKSIVHQFESH